MQFLEFLTSPHALIAILTPFFASIGSLVWANHTTPLSKTLWGQLVALLTLGCLLNVTFSFWSERGLHVVSVCSVLSTVWCLKQRISVLFVYPCSFIAILFADLVLARNHSDFPHGIGGAGWLDSLFLAPLLFTIAAYFLNKAYQKGQRTLHETKPRRLQ